VSEAATTSGPVRPDKFPRGLIVGSVIDCAVAAVMTADGLFANSIMDTGKGSAIEFLIPAGFVVVPVAGHILYRRTHIPARFIGLLIWAPIIISVVAILIAIRLWG
jgi:hypothetical protein